MSFFCKEITEIEEINRSVSLQKAIFGFTDIELISPHILSMIARNNPPMGISLGIYEDDSNNNNLIGLLVAFSTMIDKAVYISLLGVKPEFQNRALGYKLLLYFRQVALKKGLTKMFGVFDPFEANLARLYFNLLGFNGIYYEKNENINKNLGIGIESQFVDKLHVEWDFNYYDEFCHNRTINASNKNKLLNNLPIITGDFLPNNKSLLIEIPNNNFHNFSLKEISDAKNQFGEILNEYINKRHYVVNDCFSYKIENRRKTYYLLEKQ
jgi:predicted GNAT superfamily acetyltransferase